ncbi:hypothetical protein LIER_16341 [Lithospermum erythrorhizon]|uniref:Uncharacterized protein n=1 Tax=Lithospermum erythrorhizon TaxID=34254 RepID=A0AAV3Q6A0_LITER
MRVSLRDHLIVVDGLIMVKRRSTTTRFFRTINRVIVTMLHLEQEAKASILAVAVTEAFLKTITREPSYRPGYDLTPSDSSPERRDAGGSSNADLQKQVDELKALLKHITPGRGPVKHNTLLPFSDRLTHVEMPRACRDAYGIQDA